MHSLTQDYPALLLAERESPCLSLGQPTHRQHPDSVQDPLRFRDLAKQLAASLREEYPARDIPAQLRLFDALADDREFWSHTGDDLAVLGAPDFFRVDRLQRTVAEPAAVAGRVQALLIEAERLRPGRIDITGGEITTADLAHPDVDDRLGDLGEIVLGKGGEVNVVPNERMSTNAGAAAVCRV